MAHPFSKRPFSGSSRLDWSELDPHGSGGRKSLRTYSPFRILRGLPPSDRAIAMVLMIIVGIGFFASLCVLLRSFQVEVPAHGGTLKEGIVGAPRFANPLLASSDSDRDIVALTYAGLMGHSADGTLIPVLAKSYAVSDDGTMYTFTLRDGATFSDGTTVTAGDVVYTVQKAQDPALNSPAYANWKNIRPEALNATTVRFTLPAAYAPFLEDTTLGILPEHVWKDVSDDEFPFALHTSMPIGAGPFIAEDISRDDDGAITSYTFSSNKEYVLGQPHLSRIRFSFYASQDELDRAYAGGDVMSAYGIATPAAHAVPYARVFGVFFNPDKDAALSELQLRKALSLAIDRTTLTRDVLGGYASPIAGPLPAGNPAAVPLPNAATRLADAKAALESAGYEYDAAGAAWTKDGEPLSMTLTTSNVPELKAVAAQVQKDWQDLGVPTELSFQAPEDLAQQVIGPRAYSALLFGEIIGTNPDLYAFWAGSEREDPGLNIAGYADEGVDTLLQRARTETATSTASSSLAQAAAAIANAYPAAFLYSPQFLYTTPDTFHDVTLSEVSSPSDRFWGVAAWYRYTEHIWPAFLHS